MSGVAGMGGSCLSAAKEQKEVNGCAQPTLHFILLGLLPGNGAAHSFSASSHTSDPKP